MQFAPVSAIIPTKNRPDDLRRTVQTLLEETVLPHEVIVVDQSLDKQSCDAVQEEFRRAGEHLPALPRLHYIHDTSIRGLSAARNAGMAVAEESIWLFLDDDVIIDPDFTKELMQAYSGRKPADGASGIITNYASPSLAYRLWTQIFIRGPYQDKRQPIYWNADDLNHSGVLLRVPMLSGGLMSFCSELIRHIPFDVRASDCQCEDFDYCILLGNDTRLVIVPSARLKHMASPQARQESHWIRRYALSYAFIYRKHFSSRLIDRVRYYWLHLGLGLIAATASLHRFSLEPWRTYVTSTQEGFAAARESLRLRPKT